MTQKARKIGLIIVLAASGVLLTAGTAQAMEINDDADLDTSVVTDLRGCTYDPDLEVNVCDPEAHAKAVERDDRAHRESMKRERERKDKANRERQGQN